MLEMTMMNVQANNVRQMVCWSVHCSLLFSIADRCKGRVGSAGSEVSRDSRIALCGDRSPRDGHVRKVGEASRRGRD